MWGWAVMETLVRDLRYGWRALRRAPGFSAVGVLTLAIGLGATTATFGLLRTVLLRPLPYPDPGRLVMVWQTENRRPDESQLVQPQRETPVVQALARWRERSRSFESLAGYSGRYLNLTGGGAPERVVALVVTANLFPTLGVVPARGRNILPEEGEPGRGHTVILSDELWRRRFADDPTILGKTISLDGEPYSIVGVLPAGFQPLLATAARHFDLYLPLTFDANAKQALPARVIGRLREGVGLAAAQSEMDAIVAGLRHEEPRWNRDRGVRLVALADEVTGEVRPALRVLTGAVACVLLIVCANLATLMLARGAARQHEMAVRMALGAGPWCLARQLLAESVLLGLIGGGLGVAVAHWILDLIRVLDPGQLPRIEQADTSIFAFGLAISVVAGLFVGALPAFDATRAGLDSGLRQGEPRAGEGRGRLRGALVAAEMALALVLAICAALLLRSYLLLKAIEPGFASDRVLTMQLWFPERTYDQGRRAAFLAQLLERIRGLPNVESAGAATSLPLAYEALMSTDVKVQGHAQETVNTVAVTPGYVQAVCMALVSGRFLRDGDRDAVVVNESFCKRYDLESTRVLGEPIVLYGRARRIAGVVRDIRDLRLEAALRKAAVPVKLIRVPGAGHGSSFPGAREKTDWAPQALEWFETHLRKP